MDFGTQYPFPGAHRAYHPHSTFISLTPPHSQSAGPDEFNNPSPPIQQGPFADSLSQGDHFNSFDYAQGFSTHLPPGPPTPPNLGFGQHPHHYHQHRSGHRTPSTNGSVNGGSSMSRADIVDDQAGRGGSEEDDNMTPAQSRRKAQNRAAQRAFRERKEKHVKDLESKLASLEAAQREAADENERLRQDLQKMSTENEILRATSAMSGAHNSSGSPEPVTTGPMSYTPTDFYSNLLQGHQNQGPVHRIVTADDGQRLLAVGAAWDLIISHELYKRGLVDVSKVSEFMKHCAKCDGQGPVFSESDILFAIQQSVASGSDDLL